MDQLGALPSTRVLNRSSRYITRPVGPPNQPDYVNAVALVKTALEPLVLLRHLHILERKHGRVRLMKWGKRTLDLDILLYGSMSFSHPRLTIPHPRLHLRSFVLIPLYEISPALTIPRKGRLRHLIERLGQPRTEDCRPCP